MSILDRYLVYADALANAFANALANAIEATRDWMTARGEKL